MSDFADKRGVPGQWTENNCQLIFNVKNAKEEKQKRTGQGGVRLELDQWLFPQNEVLS